MVEFFNLNSAIKLYENKQNQMNQFPSKVKLEIELNEKQVFIKQKNQAIPF